MVRGGWARLVGCAAGVLVVVASGGGGPALAAGTAAAGKGARNAEEIEAGRKALLTPAGAQDLTDAMLAANAELKRPPTIPTSAFAARPLMTGPVLSPSGLSFVAAMSREGTAYLVVFTLDGSKPLARFAVPDKMDLVRYFWAGENRIVVSVGATVPWFDDEARQTRLVMIDLATGKMRALGNPGEMGLKGDDVLWVDKDGKSLLLAYQPTIYEYPAVYRIDLETNKRTRVVPPMEEIWDWHADNAGTVRYGYGWPDQHHWKMVYRKDEAAKFAVAARGTDQDDDAANDAWDRAFTLEAGTDEGYRYGSGALTRLKGVYHYNYATHTYGDLVYEAQGADLDDADLTEDGKNLQVAYFTDSRPRVKWFDPVIAELQSNLDKAVSGRMGEREVWIASRSRDGSRMMIEVRGSNDPGSLYYYQRATGAMTLIAKLNESLKPADLAVSHYVHYTARDGEEIPAYLTLPQGRAAKDLPLIVMPHGGPFDVRDDGSFDPEVQFLVNRGYAVLQPEYRGSGSYGERFDELGMAQWGRAMQDDIDDGMDWLAKRGVIDPKRACIVGASYGGYAAIWGGTRNPERWRCAVSFAGISDLPRHLKFQMNSDTDKRSREKWRARVQGADTFDLKTLSGLFNIDWLKVPMLLVHGDKDQRVPVKQSRIYADALKAAGKTYEYYELPGEGHGFSSAANAQTWYDKLDAFLAKYNPAS